MYISTNNLMVDNTNTIVLQDGMPGVYGVDCEMCYTSVGLELTKVPKDSGKKRSF